jgi:hypothetical protein
LVASDALRFRPKHSVLVGLFKFLAVGCGLNECSLERTVSMISPKSSLGIRAIVKSFARAATPPGGGVIF